VLGGSLVLYRALVVGAGRVRQRVLDPDERARRRVARGATAPQVQLQRDAYLRRRARRVSPARRICVA